MNGYLMKTAGLHGAFVGVISSFAQAQPASDYKRSDSVPAETSPDGTLVLEQYIQEPLRNFAHFEFWIFDRAHQHACLLNPGETGMTSVYPAGFRFSPDSRWLVRMQKTAAGESTLFLYHREGQRFAPATARQLGDLAWDFLSTQSDDPTVVSGADLSPETVLVAGMQDDYLGLGEHWPDSRYIVIDLVSGESGSYPFGPWRCVYDTQTAKFAVPPEINAFNRAEAEKQKGDQQAWLEKRRTS